MKEPNDYLKFYFLEDYLFGGITKSFKDRGYLIPEEFFAIIFWKRKASGVKIASRWSKESIKCITSKLCLANKKNSLNILLGRNGGIKGVGIAIASAILTVCYPKDFTVIDYRVLNSLKKLKIEVEGDPENNPDDYLKYVDLCKIKARGFGLTLRNFDRALWAMDWYKGENGLVEVAEAYRKTFKGI